MTHFDPETLSRYVEGDLPLPVQRDVDRHVAECDPCLSEVNDLLEIDSLVAALGAGAVQFPPETDVRIRSAVVRRRRLSPLVALSRMMPMALGSGVAALLVVASVNLGILFPSGPSAVAGPTAATPRVLAQQTSPLRNARRTSALLGAQPVLRSGTPTTNIRLKVN